ncbi:MAG: hypothetical protein KAS32_22805 [Candidatus Peribacteraceae bacterium]|nr:hypothetical protein [Candidatus Peribacteraceae bacterium]
MKDEFLAMVVRKYGEEIRDRCQGLAFTEELSDASDVYVLDRALYEKHKAEIDVADIEARLPFDK